MIDDIIVIDNAIPKNYQDEIEELLLGNNSFPWYFINDVTLTEDKLKNAQAEALCPALTHVFYNESNPNYDQWFDFIKPLAYYACDKINYNVREIINSRTFLQLPTHRPKIHSNYPHVDLPFPHLVCLYYVNDNEAHTNLYSQTIETTSMKDIKSTNFDLIKQVEPKKGRCLFFNGKHYHSSSSPMNGPRCIINFDVV